MPSARVWAPVLMSFLLLFAPWVTGAAAGAEAPVPSASPPAAMPVVDTVAAAAIQALLADSCLKCHGEVKQRGRLRLDSRAAMLQGGKSGPAIIPGDAQHSLLMQAVRYDDPDLQMPPDQPLAPEQVAALASWIAAGAPWSGNAPVSASAPSSTSSTSLGISASAGALTPRAPDTHQRAAAATPPTHHPAARRPPLIGRVHPIVVHFPIACLLLAVLAEFLVVTGGPRWDPLVRFLMVFGTLGAVVAVVSGTWFAPEGTLFHHEDPLLTRHEFVGWVTMILSLVASAVLIAARAPRARLIFRLLILLTAAVAGLTGHLGGSMVYGEHFLF